MSIGTCISSGQLSISGFIFNKAAILYGYQVAAGSIAATLTIYDGLSAVQSAMVDNQSFIKNTVQSQWYSQSILCSHGLYVTIDGAGATYIIYYMPV